MSNTKLHNKVNAELGGVLPNGKYFNGLPLEQLFDVLCANNLRVAEDNLLGVYCGAEGRVHARVGPQTWFTMTWYKMDSGRYEVLAYVS